MVFLNSYIALLAGLVSPTDFQDELRQCGERYRVALPQRLPADKARQLLAGLKATEAPIPHVSPRENQGTRLVSHGDPNPNTFIIHPDGTVTIVDPQALFLQSDYFLYVNRPYWVARGLFRDGQVDDSIRILEAAYAESVRMASLSDATRPFPDPDIVKVLANAYIVKREYGKAWGVLGSLNPEQYEDDPGWIRPLLVYTAFRTGRGNQALFQEAFRTYKDWYDMNRQPCSLAYTPRNALIVASYYACYGECGLRFGWALVSDILTLDSQNLFGLISRAGMLTDFPSQTRFMVATRRQRYEAALRDRQLALQIAQNDANRGSLRDIILELQRAIQQMPP